MKRLSHLLENNKRWAREIAAKDPDFFPRLAERQQPDCMWIGCSDSRTPVSRIAGLAPGEAFVHRNIANLAQTRDLSCQSALQFAIETLHVRHVIVCGHYGCGGVLSAVSGAVKKDAAAGVPANSAPGGLVEEWIAPIKHTRRRHASWLDNLAAERQADALCELNALEQARALARNRIVRRHWRAGRALDLHAWIYHLRDGRIRELGFDCGRDDAADSLYARALDGIKHDRARPRE